jgi:hypothetical protein
MLVATAVWAVGLPLAPQLAGSRVTGTATGILVGFALLAALTAGVALLRMPSDPVTAPFVGLAATVGTLLALAPLDRPADGGALISFLLVAPWRYALTPLVVHFTLEVGWPHRRPRWAGWILGWYAIEVGMLVVVAVGMALDEGVLVNAVDHTFRANILEPAGAATALIGALLALATPVRGRVLRGALGWTTAAVAIGLAPLLLSEYLPAIGQSIDGAVTPARLALVALPVFALIAVLSLPFRDAAARDLLAHRLAAGLLEGTDLSGGLRQIAIALHETFNARGVAVRITEPEIVATIGEIAPQGLRGPIAPEMEAGDEHQELVAPIGRAGNPLGDVRLEGRFAGAFGPTERDWLAALLLPISAVLRSRRRELVHERRNVALASHLASTLGAVAAAARDLPLAQTDAGMAIPPPVDAREVLAQMSDGVTGIARNGEGLATAADEVRHRARGASDSVARGLDALSALSAEVARLSRYGEEIAASNDTVSGVAFRTNLVANNAALEATRAGAAGRTFGVLAEEVRRLADTTAATSAAIGERTAALAAEVAKVGTTLDGTRQALAAAIRETEAGEAAAQRLNDAAAELEDTARSLRPVVAEANAVAKRRTARDEHLTATMERFLVERAGLARALTLHRDAMERLATTLGQLAGTD